jgi:hypothetical protein
MEATEAKVEGEAAVEGIITKSISMGKQKKQIKKLKKTPKRIKV